jgi:hypothetical protein
VAARGAAFGAQAKNEVQWDLQTEGALGSENSTRWRGRGETSPGSLGDGWATSQNEGDDMGRP